MSMNIVIYINIKISSIDAIFLLLIISEDNVICSGHNFKMPTIVGILKCLTMANFMLTSAVNLKMVYNLGA